MLPCASVNMIATMGLRVKAQTPEAQRMARKSFPLAPSCRRGRRQPSKGSGQPRMPHIAARPAPLQYRSRRPATSPDAPLRKGSKLAFNVATEPTPSCSCCVCLSHRGRGCSPRFKWRAGTPHPP
eukprot:scaffold118922_cov87-Phaeocystis_antarctica.AAC.1